METLRSPKHLAGPAMGLPNLAFRTWFEAKFGEPAWQDLGKIPRPMWMDYLTWYRQVLALPVENNASVLDISSTPHGFDLTVRQGGEERVLPAGGLSSPPDGKAWRAHACPPPSRAGRAVCAP